MTHKNSWKKSERDVARFHHPGTGERTPLSGISSGITHADCKGVDGLFIEVKYRSKFALWTLYDNTTKLAKGEGNVPVVVIKEKGKNGFIDLIHSKYLDQFVQHMVRNREIKVVTPEKVTVYDQEMPLIFKGTPAQVRFLIDKLVHNSFNGKGELRNEWWSMAGEKFATWVQVSEGFQIALYGHFNHPFKVMPNITQEMLNMGLKAHSNY